MDNGKKNQIIVADEILPEEIVLLPNADRPVFPGMVVPMVFSEGLNLDTIEFITNKRNGIVGIVQIRDIKIPPGGKASDYDITVDDLYTVGSAGKIIKALPSPKGNDVQILINLQKRFKIVKLDKVDPHLIARVRYFDEDPNDVNDEQIKAYVGALISKIKELIKLNSIFSEEMKLFISRYGSNAPGQLTDMVTNMLTSLSVDQVQDVLETVDLHERIPKVLNFIHKEIEIARMKEQINKRVEEKINKQQRTFFLQEQLKSIKQELGLEKDEKSADIDKIKDRMKELKLSEEAEKVLNEEIEKLSLYDVRSSEYGVSRNYINWILSLPWGIESDDNFDLKNVEKILNRDHYGLEDIKERIIEFVAVQKLKNSISGSILCFVGPPGVGKTSLGKSIAHAINRKYYNFSVGGMRDEAEIKGHRRTYIGAMPGKIIQALKSAGTCNPVIMLDEIEKLSSSYHGDPSSALLEVLDPEQNYQFMDHYLDVRFDLSKILFIATANQLDTIPPPLLDRMEIIRLSGYLLEEKRRIAVKYLIPKNLPVHGLKNTDIKFSAKGIDSIIRYYAREAGVRTLEQQIKKIMRKVATERARGKRKQVLINDKGYKKYLGMEVFLDDSPYDKVVPGIVTGLAWTAMGGSTLYIEAIKVSEGKGRGMLKLTGQLGKVMEESAQIALSYVRSIASDYRIDPDFFNNSLIHLHVPAGAVPKDGPSAGITMALALFSLAAGKKVTASLAMTGELTVSGYVLPIGGVKEKVIGAKRAGKKRLIFPEENRKDFDELPEYVKKGIRIHFVKRFEDVIKIAL